MEIHSRAKLEIAKLVYPRVVDKKNVNRVLIKFGYSSTKTDFMNWAKKQK